MKALHLWCAAWFMLVLVGCTHAPVKKHTARDSFPEITASNIPLAGETSTSGGATPESADPEPLLPPSLLMATPTTLWGRIRSGFSIPGRSRPQVEQWIRVYTRYPEHLKQVLTRARPFMRFIVQQISQRGMPMEIALLPAVESGFDPYAYSSSAAAGLWQFIPTTARRYGLHMDWWYDGRRDVAQATRAALNYLQFLHGQLGTWTLALAGYNCGGGCIINSIRYNALRNDPTDFWHLPLREETTEYVPKLLALSAIVAHPAHYGITLPDMADSPHLQLVTIPRQMSLARIASLANVNTDTINKFNPGQARWATDPNGPNALLIPADRVQAFKAGLNRLADGVGVHWLRYRIRNGDTLGKIAHRFDTTVRVLQKMNHLQGTLIRAKHIIVVPAAPSQHQDKQTRVVSNPGNLQQAANTEARVGIMRYTVRRGDTLWGISRKLHLRVAQIAHWNGLEKNAVLQPGQTLVLHDATDAANSKQPRTRQHTIHYTVKKGDSLYAIAVHFGVGITDLQRWNHISGFTIHPGERLKIKVSSPQQYES